MRQGALLVCSALHILAESVSELKLRYRLTVISVVVAALVAAAVVVGLNRDEDRTPEREPNDLFSGGLGIVGALTATARAGGGGAIDPTALVTPSTMADSSPTPSPTTGPTATESPENTGHISIEVPDDDIAPGELISIEISGAAPDESLDLAISEGGSTISGVADSNGNALIQVRVPENASGQTIEIALQGSLSGAASTEITVSSIAPLVSVDPSEPAAGESVEITVENFSPGEQITITISGQPVASGVAGSDGSLRITTGIPGLPQSENGSHMVSVEGSTGTAAMTDIAPSQPQTTAPTATTAQSPSAQEQPADASETSADDNGENLLSGMPAWVYFAAGVLVGWLLLLTVWVIRIDRSRERVVASMIAEMKKFDGSQTEIKLPGESLEKSDGSDSQTAA